MLDIQQLRDHPDEIKKRIATKGFNPGLVDQILKLDQFRRQLIQQAQDIRQHRNELNRQLKNERTPELIQQSQTLKQELINLEPQLKKVESDFINLFLQIPNPPLEEVPVGKDESGNVPIKTWGEKPPFDFTPLDHIQLGLKLDLLDLDRGSKVAGYRGYFLKNQAVLMHLGLMHYALDKMSQAGFTPIVPPIINRKEAFVNSGHFPWGETEAYAMMPEDPDKVEIITSLGTPYQATNLNTQSDTYLAGTAEVPLVSLHAGETLSYKDLPLLYAGFSPSYRREIGSYGKDTRGLYRVHEFLKIEQIVITVNDWEESIKWHEKLAQISESMLQELGLHYRVLLMCTGDMGEPQAKKYDIETWMPGRNSFGETMSDSIMGDFQARRANIRYQDHNGQLKFAHTLNNTALASPRILVALWENYQQKDGSILIPPALRPYVGFEKIEPPQK